jgi:hypothetical protein
MEVNMRSLRLVSTAIVVAMMLLSQSQSASAGPATHFSVQLDNATIPWFIPVDSFCPEVPAGIVINPDASGSDRVKNAILNIRPDGTRHVVVTDQVAGTATDNFGETYEFIYLNNTTLEFDGSMVTAHMKDTFKIKGGDVNYTVGFNWSWAYPADSLDVFEVPGDIGIDPLMFATSDGVNEDPGIISGSWQRLSTRGDPWKCDPL